MPQKNLPRMSKKDLKMELMNNPREVLLLVLFVNPSAKLSNLCCPCSHQESHYESLCHLCSFVMPKWSFQCLAISADAQPSLHWKSETGSSSPFQLYILQTFQILKIINIPWMSKSCYYKIQDNIDHQFDVWHFCKSVKVKLLNAAKKKACEELKQWIKLICKHFWWSQGTIQKKVWTHQVFCKIAIRCAKDT